MGRSVMIYVMGSFIILSIALMNAGRNVDSAGTKSVEYMRDSKARNVCNSMTSILITRLADSTTLRIETPVTESFMGGTVTYQMYSVNSVGDIVNDSNEGEDHEDDDHGEDHEDDDHGDDHSSMFTSPLQKQNPAIFSASILGAFSFSSASSAFDDDHSDDHESDDHDDDESDDHDDDDGEDHGGDHDDSDDPADGDTIKIVVSATVSSSTKTQTTYVAITPPASATTAAIQGGVSSNSPIETKGNLIIDGRNHDLNGTLVSNTGIYGVWTTSTLNQSGSSKIGGTKSSTDYAPSKPANSNTVKTSGSFSGGFPISPDEVFGGSSAGFPDGTIKDFAISGANGSQYVTDPSDLTTPFSGITYVELPNGETWQSMSISGTGVLIVHNANRNAIMKNLNSGTFKGIIIADDIIHVHTSIYGAIISLSSSPSDGNCIGNGNGSILYSKAAVDQAVSTVNSFSTSKNYGFGKMRMNVIGWYDQQ